MQTDSRRITLVNRTRSSPHRRWLATRDAPCRIIFVETFGAIPYVLARGVEELERDVENVIVDGTATALEYLHLLATLPPAFHGDVALILEDCAFVSALGRGGDRVLYALRPEDVHFYLETKLLTAPAEPVTPSVGWAAGAAM